AGREAGGPARGGVPGLPGDAPGAGDAGPGGGRGQGLPPEPGDRGPGDDLPPGRDRHPEPQGPRPVIDHGLSSDGRAFLRVARDLGLPTKVREHDGALTPLARVDPEMLERALDAWTCDGQIVNYVTA